MSTISDTLIKWPSRARPDLFARQFPLWDVPGVRFLVTVDHDDETLSQYLECLRGRANVKVHVSNCRGKVEAINDGVADEPWDFCILASDDFSPQRPDYADYLRGVLFARFPDGDGVVHQDDGRTGKRLNTCPIMGRAYFDRFDYIYHPAFKSLWCDDEFQAVSESLGRSVYIDECVLKHDWIGQQAPDDLHHRNEQHYQRDAAVFQERKLLGFPTNV
jgi:hypothetical protein